MWELATTSLRTSVGRFVAAIVAIAIGIAFLVSGSMLVDSITRTLGGELDERYAAVDLAVTPRLADEAADDANGPRGNGAAGSLPDGTLELVRSTDGVAAASGEFLAATNLLRDGRRLGTGLQDGLVTLRNWPTDSALNPLQIDQGRAPRAKGEVAIDLTTADKRGLSVGSTVSFSSTTGATAATVVGITRFGTVDRLDNSGTISAAEPWVFELGGDGDPTYGRVLVRVEPSTSAATVRRAIGERLPASVEVITGSEFRDNEKAALEAIASFLRPILSGFGYLSVFVCALVILNTFLVVVAQRRRELALLRAVAATPRQVVGALCLEGAIIGAIGGVIGIATGIGLTFGFAALLEALDLGLPPARITLNPAAMVTGFIVAVLATLVASLLPAVRGSRVPPVAAMRSAAVEPPGLPKVRSIIAAVLLAAGSVALVVGGSIWLVIPSILGMVAGIFAIGPAVSYVIARISHRLLGTHLVPLRLAADGIGRHPRRASFTANALVIGVFLISLTSVAGNALSRWAVDQVNQLSSSDYVVTSFVGGFPEGLAARLAKLDGVDTAVTFRAIPVNDGGAPVRVLATNDARALPKLGLTAAEGRLDRLGDGIAALTINRRPARLGDKVVLGLPDGSERTFEVTAVLEPNVDTAFFQGYVMSPETLASIGGEPPSDSLMMIKAAPGQVDELGKRIDETVAPYNVFALAGNFFGQLIEGFFAFLINAVSALLGVSVVVALVGIVNTISLSIFERRRELGLLRAVGMTKRELRRMVRVESVLIAVQGTLIGLVSGSFLAWALLRATDIGSAGLPWARLGLIGLGGALVGLFASVVPARRVTRLDIVDALAD